MVSSYSRAMKDNGDSVRAKVKEIGAQRSIQEWAEMAQYLYAYGEEGAPAPRIACLDLVGPADKSSHTLAEHPRNCLCGRVHPGQ